MSESFNDVFFGRKRHFPSKEETEKARRKVLRELESGSPLQKSPVIQAFAKGWITVGTMIILDGRLLILRGVFAEKEFPQAMAFSDFHERKFIYFYGPLQLPFRIVRG
jgi:hypothetical protein